MKNVFLTYAEREMLKALRKFLDDEIKHHEERIKELRKLKASLEAET